jgi:uncharacterized delta-60 repeat protein
MLTLLGAALVVVVGPATATPGVLDPSFDFSGEVTTLFQLNAGINALVLQPDGKVVAVGNSEQQDGSSNLTLARYETNGALDASFGSNGVVQSPIGLGAVSAALQQGGKIVVAGTSYTPTPTPVFTLARYNPDGSLDTSFGSGGIVQTPSGTGGSRLEAMALQPDGKIVAAGSAYNGSQDVVALARYSANGSLDTTFGSGGIVTTPVGTSASALAVAFQGNGQIVAAGLANNGSQNAITIARYDADGSLDAGFGSSGIVTTPVGSAAGARSLVLQPDGKIVAVGGAYNGDSGEFALARYNADGSLDPTFGAGGLVTTPIGDSAGANEAALQPDGKILVAGSSTSGSTGSFALARYNSDGSLDVGFAGDGIASTTIGTNGSGALALALQPDGKVILGGSAQFGNGAVDEFALARYLGSTLTVQTSGTGSGSVSSSPAGVSCGTTCVAPFAAVPVTLTATPAAGSILTGWSGGGCSGTGVCNVQMSSDESVTATFSVTPTKPKPACIVPKLKGQSLKIARRRITRADCRTGRINHRYSKTKRGHVISQRPRPRRRLRGGFKINLVVSKGVRR